MNIKNALKLVKRNLKLRKKDLIVTTILLILSIMTFLLGITFSKGMNLFIENSLNEIPKNRILVFHSTELEYSLVSEYIKNGMNEGLLLDSGEMIFGKVGILNVPEVMKRSENYINENNETTIITEFYNTAYDQFLVEGNGIKKLDFGKIVLPLYFNTTNNFDQYSEFFVDHSSIDSGLNYLGSKISIEFLDLNDEKFVEEFEVVGVYDNSNTQNSLSDALVSYNDLKRIAEKIQTNAGQVLNSYYVITNSNQENENVIKSIRAVVNNNLNVRKIVNFEPVNDFILITTILSYLISLILLLVALIYISIITIRNVSMRKREIGLLYSVGYSFKTIMRIFLYENILIATLGYFFSFIFYDVIIRYINNKIVNEGIIDIVNIHFEIQVIMCLVVLFVGMGLIVIVTNWQLGKINRIEITEIMKETK